MSLNSINSGVTAAQSLELKKPATANAPAQEQAKTNSNLSKSDSLKTSGLSKNPAWEGVKLGAKQGLKEGLIAGPIAGAAGAALIVGGVTLLGTGKFNPMALGGKFIAGGAAIGLVAGPIIAIEQRTKEGAGIGAAVGVAVKHAKEQGKDEVATVEKYGKLTGAATGALRGAYDGFRTSKTMSTNAKIGFTVAGTLIGATGGYFAGGILANKIYTASK